MNRIREHRERMGLTQKQLADRMGISESTVARHESGQRKPDHWTRESYALHLLPETDVSSALVELFPDG